MTLPGQLIAARTTYRAWPCLRIAGELDLATEGVLRAALEEMGALAPPVLVIDLCGLAYMDSSGVNALLEAYRAAGAERRRIVLLAPQTGVVRRVLDLMELGGVMEVIEAPGEGDRPGDEGPAPARR
jgi:anti-anti-sigma factor